MANPDRLTALDASFLHIEKAGPAHLHVASVALFEGRAPSVEELIDHVVARLHLVPRYRQRLAFVPFAQGRPTWIDDPFFNASYHIRSTALPRPAGERQLRLLAGRVLSNPLDRARPLWELWLVDRLAGGRFALVTKTHHAVVDGVSGVDLASVLFDADADAAVAHAREPWHPRPLPGPARLLGEALLERATVPAEIARGVRAGLRTPSRMAGQVGRALPALLPLRSAAARVPVSPLNVEIGPHRRVAWVDAELDGLRAIKDALGGTLNDALLTVVSLGLGAHLRVRGHVVDGLVLRAMVPLSVAAEPEDGALGHRVGAVWAPLPVGESDPRTAHRAIVAAMAAAGPAVSAEVLTDLAGFAPPTILSQAARLRSRERTGHLVVTNVPGPQRPLYLMGRQLRHLYPLVPLGPRQALALAALSYDGRIGFGLLGDYDAMPALDDLAGELQAAIVRLAEAAGLGGPARQPRPR